MRNLLLGIDPSYNNFGVCIYDPTKKDEPKTKGMLLFTGTMADGVDWIQENCKLRNIIAVVENPDLDKSVFGAFASLKKEILKYRDYELWLSNKIGNPPPRVTMINIQSEFAIKSTVAQKIGENKAAAKQIIIMLKAAGVPVLEVAPSKRDKAFSKKTGKVVRKDVRFLKSPTKTTQAQFKELTGYEKSSSEHARDAATLVHGRGMTWAKNMIAIAYATNEKQPSKPNAGNSNYYLVRS